MGPRNWCGVTSKKAHGAREIPAGVSPLWGSPLFQNFSREKKLPLGESGVQILEGGLPPGGGEKKEGFVPPTGGKRQGGGPKTGGGREKSWGGANWGGISEEQVGGSPFSGEKNPLVWFVNTRGGAPRKYCARARALI